MFLTRVETEKTAKDAYDHHKILWDAFPGKHDKRPFLFRVENDNEKSGKYIVLSSIMPGLEKSVLSVSVISSNACSFKEDAEIDFTLRANPTICGDRKRRHSVVLNGGGAEAAIRWFKDRATSFGVDLMDVEVRGMKRVNFNKGAAGVSAGTIIGVDYVGRLRVTNAALFAKSMGEGIGRGKAFGYGLILPGNLEDKK